MNLVALWEVRVGSLSLTSEPQTAVLPVEKASWVGSSVFVCSDALWPVLFRVRLTGCSCFLLN